MSSPTRTEDPTAPATASRTLGIAAVAALIVPPGLLVAPLCGLTAVVLGVIALSRPDGAARERALVGLSLGLAALAASLILMWLLHPLFLRVLDDINYG